MPTLIHLPYSAWSERARWALDHHRLRAARVVHVPGPGELLLRARTGRWRGRVTVPVLVLDDGTVLDDSLAIGRWADANGQGPKLLADEPHALRWHAVADDLADAGRVLATRASLRDDAALREMIPGFLRVLGPLALPIARRSAQGLLDKYDPAVTSDAAAHARVEAALAGIRAGLDGRATLGPTFSWADLVVASALDFVRPRASGPLGPASRRAWTIPDLAERYADVLAWRDAVYASSRKPA